jgi:3-oxoacyl-[acyl-carrier-protein] synthase II
VTGLGIVSPVGIGIAETWQNIVAGKSGIGRITRFDPSAFACQVAGEVNGFDATQYIPAKDARRMDRFVHFGLAAGIEAFKDSGLVVTEQNAERIGVCISSGIGGLPMIEETHNDFLAGGPRKISPFFIPGTIINMISGNLSIMFGMKGPNFSVVTACTTGTHSIGESARIIEYGDADVMIAGGSESTISPLAIGGFSSAKALSTRNDDPATSSRPWDKDRDGFVMGEGAGVLVLEEYEHAKARGAKIYGEVAGYGATSDGHDMVAPSGEGAVRCMRQALVGVGPKVDYINPHGTSTPVGDIKEIEAIREVFGGADKSPPISATKSLTGHSLGATGVQEAIYSLLMMNNGFIGESAHIENIDPDIADMPIVRKRIDNARIGCALSNSFGFGGTNASLVMKHVDA